MHDVACGPFVLRPSARKMLTLVTLLLLMLMLLLSLVYLLSGEIFDLAHRYHLHGLEHLDARLVER